MKKLLSALKIIVFILGLFTLILIGIGGALLVFDSIKPRPTPATAEPFTLYETNFNTQTLKVIVSEKDGDRVVTMDISGSDGTSATIKMEDRWSEITDSMIIPLGDGKYGIVLFYKAEECDFASYVIDLFTYGNGIKFIETITTTESYQLDSASALFATLPVNAPYVSGFKSWGFSIPVEIRVGREIIITPLLTREGIALIQRVAAKDRQSIIDSLTQGGEEDDLQNYLNAEQELNRALAARTITF